MKIKDRIRKAVFNLFFDEIMELTCEHAKATKPLIVSYEDMDIHEIKRVFKLGRKLEYYGASTFTSTGLTDSEILKEAERSFAQEVMAYAEHEVSNQPSPDGSVEVRMRINIAKPKGVWKRREV